MDGQAYGSDGRWAEHRWIRYGRARLNVAMRLASRSHSVLSLGGAARGPLRLAVAGSSAAVDLAMAGHLRRSDRPSTGLHAAVNAVDLATWTLLQTRPGPAQLSTAINSGHPLAVEAGARYGWRAVLVPLGGAVLAEGAARSRGRRSEPAAFAWQLAAVAGGAGLSRYVDRLRTRRLKVHEVLAAAESARAELAAQNEVAIGVGNVIDEVQRAASLIRMAADVPGRAVPWKAELAARTRRTHRYLIDVLLAWQQDHNAGSADLATVVDFVVDPALAPVVLDGAAATRLEDVLSGKGRHGRVRVSGGGSTGGGPSAEIALRIGAERLLLDTGVEPLRLHVDPLPGGFAWLALWLAAAGPQDGVGAVACLGPAAVALGLTAWSHLAGRHGAPTPATPAVVASSGLTAFAAVVQTRRVRTPRDQPDIPRIPMSLGLRGHALVTALAAPRLPAPVLAGAIGAGLGTVALAWWVTPGPAPLREFVAELSWSVMSAVMARSFTEGIERDAIELESDVRADDRRRRRLGADLGRSRALAQVRMALDEAIALEQRYRPVLPVAVAAEARRRLDLAEQQLAAVMPPPPASAIIRP